MFDSFDDLLSWQSMTAQTDGYLSLGIKSGGYSDVAIVEFEEYLKDKLHLSFRQFLMRYNLDNLAFHTVSFGQGIDYLRKLRSYNPKMGTDGYLNLNGLKIAAADGYTILIDNTSGNIQAEEDFYLQPFVIAEDIYNFIIIAASLIRITWSVADEEENNDELIRYIEEFIRVNTIKSGYNFWYSFAFSAV